MKCFETALLASALLGSSVAAVGQSPQEVPFHKRLDVTQKFNTEIPLPLVVLPIVSPAASRHST